ncbi:MAG TPA: TonB family protein [Pyrinomonadaceae bacterium]|nr:TonB family protein [Pyrinomonadaceae bacterium]
MPLNVRRFRSAGFAFLLIISGSVLFTTAQTVSSTTTAMVPPHAAPTSGDVMRDRISKSKAYIAVRNYNAAIYELENIRKETSDPDVRGVVNVLLMNSYLEQGDYKRAQDLLNEFYAAQKTTKPNSSESYMSVAGQIIKGARSRAERYKALGLSVSDRTLPLEATNDLEKMRETLEIVITQSKEIGANKARAADAMMLLEEASSSRSMLARDNYDLRRWKDEVADTREKMARGSSVVVSAMGDVAATDGPSAALVGENTKPPEKASVIIPVVDKAPPAADDKIATPVQALTREREVEPAEKVSAESTVAQHDKPIAAKAEHEPIKEAEKPKGESTEEPKPVIVVPGAKPVNNNSPLEVGSLIAYATSKSPPVYPSAAKSIRATGVVKVEVTISETGEVTEIQKASGHMMLQAAARDAIRKWKFKPFVRDGQPVKATGFVNFNFAL